MKIITFFLLLIHSVYAYEVGSSLDEKVITTLELKNNKIYIIDFFASWCASCEKEIPDLNTFNTTLDSSKYTLIGVDIDKDIQSAKAFQEALHVNFKVINDSKQDIVSKFKPLGMPSLYIVKDTKVVHVIVGAKDNIAQELTSYLKGLHE